MPQLQVMQWDFKDQLNMTCRQKVDDNDEDGIVHQGQRTYYVYDGAGQRVRKATESSAGITTKERLYVGGFEIYREYGAGGEPSLERETLHVMDDKKRVALVETKTNDAAIPATLLPATTKRYQFDNHLGTACLELDENAAVISYEEYTPYGSTSYQAGRTLGEVSFKRYRYTGKERDEETGLSYHTGRYYASWLGKWSSADPSGVEFGVNAYVYAATNPVKFYDLTGNNAVLGLQLVEAAAPEAAAAGPVGWTVLVVVTVAVVGYAIYQESKSDSAIKQEPKANPSTDTKAAPEAGTKPQTEQEQKADSGQEKKHETKPKPDPIQDPLPPNIGSDDSKKNPIVIYRNMKKDASGRWREGPPEGASNQNTKGARTPKSVERNRSSKNLDPPRDVEPKGPNRMVGPTYTPATDEKGKKIPGLSASLVHMPLNPEQSEAQTTVSELPEGLGWVNDHNEHVSIFPARDMTFEEYQNLLNQVPWREGGHK